MFGRLFGRRSQQDGGSAPPVIGEPTLVLVSRRHTTFVSTLEPGSFAGVNLVPWLDPPEQAGFETLPSPGYLGVLVTPKDRRAAPLFLPNNEFIEFLHYGVAAIGPTLPEFRAQVAGQASGSVFLLDQRFEQPSADIANNDDLPREEIIGIFGIADGAITEASYLRSLAYGTWTRWGPSRLQPFLRAPLIERLRQLPIPEEIPLPGWPGATPGDSR